MKVRLGFVSNSSGSSFVLAIAVVGKRAGDKERAHDFIKNLVPEKGWDYMVKFETVNDLMEKGVVRNDSASISGFNGDIVHINGIQWDDEILIVDITNNEGDGPFWNEEAGEMEYSRAWDVLPEWQQDLYNELGPDNGFSRVDKKFGAERNG